MFPGFFIGTVFLFWLVRTIMWGPRHRYGYGYRRPWGPGPFDASTSLWGDFGEPDRPARERRDPPRSQEGLDDAVRRFVGALRERLHATPSQEKAFDAAVTELRRATVEIRARAEKARDDIARAVRSQPFDGAAFDDAARRMAEALDAIRDAARRVLADVHGTLDERQRDWLADLIRSSRVDL
jgi:hypothetical protein